MINNKIKAEQIWEHIGVEFRPGEKPTQQEVDLFNQTQQQESYTRTISLMEEQLRLKIYKVIDKLQKEISSYPEDSHHDYFQSLLPEDTFVAQSDTIDAMLRSINPNDKQVKHILKKLKHIESTTIDTLEFKQVTLNDIEIADDIPASTLETKDSSTKKHSSGKRIIIPADLSKVPSTIVLWGKLLSSIEMAGHFKKRFNRTMSDPLSSLKSGLIYNNFMLSTVLNHYYRVYNIGFTECDFEIVNKNNSTDRLNLTDVPFFKSSISNPNVFEILLRYWTSMRCDLLDINKEDLSMHITSPFSDKDVNMVRMVANHYDQLSTSREKPFCKVAIPVVISHEVCYPVNFPTPVKIKSN